MRNVIERSFGVLKKRWNILNLMPPYSYPSQVKIVVVAMTFYNFIIEQRLDDKILKFLMMKVFVSMKVFVLMKVYVIMKNKKKKQ